MCEKDARTRNRECCHCAISLIAKFWPIANMFQTDFANSEFLASFPLLLRFLHYFSPKNPNFDPQHPDLFPKVVYRLMYIKNTQNYIEFEIKTSFQHNSSFDPFFIKTLKTNTNSWIHQQQNYISSIMSENTKYTYIHILSM